MRNHKQRVQGKANRRNPCVGATGESDGDIVPGKLANKGEQPPAEPMEGREPTKRNPQKEATRRVQDRESVSNRLERVRQRAEADRKEAFVNLFSLLKVPLLREAFYSLKRSASAGLDGVGWYEYERQLEARLPELQREAKRGPKGVSPEWR